MKKSPSLVVLALALALTLVAPARAQGDLLKVEQIGKLRHGMSVDKVITLLGQPTKRSAEVSQAATATFVQTWTWAGKGISMVVSSAKAKDPKKIVDTISVTAPCQLRTAKGIHVGSSDSEVRKQYASVIDKEASGPTTIVAGSVYGGVIFTIAKGRVTRIFLGAAAE